MSVIVDTGPLVALLDERDRHHAWARAAFARVRAPLATCDAVLSEDFRVYRRNGRGVIKLIAPWT